MIRRPMLAPQEDPMSYPKFFKDLQYPLLASPKFDGIRGVVQGAVMSRTMKPIRSYQVQDRYKDLRFCDGELIIGEPTNPDCYNLCQSHVMSFDKPHEDLRYYVFDWTEHTSLEFYRRLEKAEEYVNKVHASVENLFFVPHVIIENEDDLLSFEDKCLEEGYEGIMGRDPLGIYKEGRATWKQALIFKLKRFTDDEGLIVGFEEGTENKNEQETDERGYAKRSKARDGLVASGMLGKFLVDYKGLLLKVAPGNFKHEQRKEIWERQDEYLNKHLKFRFFGYGVKDLPRFPRAVGFRDKEDM